MNTSSTATRPSTVVFTYHDPGKTYDGTPYEAAGLAVDQCKRVMNLYQRALRDTAIQVRNSYMQRNLDLTGDPSAATWTDSAEAKALAVLFNHSKITVTKLGALQRAAAYDPKHPPKA